MTLMNTLDFNDKRYDVVRSVKIESFEDKDEVLRFKTYCHSETVIKHDGKYYFCNEISDAIFVGDPKPPEPIQTPT